MNNLEHDSVRSSEAKPTVAGEKKRSQNVGRRKEQDIRRRSSQMRKAAYASIKSAKNFPHSLSAAESLAFKLFNEGGGMEPRPEFWEINGDPFVPPWGSPLVAKDRERIGGELFVAAWKYGLSAKEAYRAIDEAITQLADENPGF